MNNPERIVYAKMFGEDRKIRIKLGFTKDYGNHNCVNCAARELGLCNYSEFTKFLSKHPDTGDILEYREWATLCDLFNGGEYIRIESIEYLEISETDKKDFVIHHQEVVINPNRFCRNFCPLYSGKDLLCRKEITCPFKNELNIDLHTIAYD